MQHSRHLRRRTIWLFVLGACIGLLALGAALVLVRTPSNDRAWVDDHLRIATTAFEWGDALIHDVRDFSYAPDGTPTVRYIDRRVPLDRVEGVDFIISHFSEQWGVAHAFLSFRITGEEPLAISIEARREVGEEYSPLRGLFRTYEEIYVIGTERDLLGLRTHIRGEDVYLYRGVTTPERARTLLISMLERASALAAEPQFYNTLTSQCTNELARHVDEASPKEIPYSWKMLLPGYADELAYELGFLDTSRPFAELQAAARLDPARTTMDSPRFSEEIRGA